MEGNQGRPHIVERRPLVDQRKKETMLMVLVRNVVAHEAVRSVLTPKHVRAMGEGFAVLWRVVCDFFDRRHALPTRELIMDDLQNLIADRPDDLDPAELVELDTFLECAFDDKTHGCVLAESRMHCDEAIYTVQMFVEELAAAELTELVGGTSAPLNMPALLQRAHQEVLLAAGLAQANCADDNVFPDGWDVVEHRPLRSTGISFFDNFLGGGDEPGEVMGVLGPTGSCKTLLAVQGAAEAVQQADRLYMGGQTGGRVPKVIYVSTEELKKDFRIRILSYLARIPRERLARMTALDQLCRAPAPGAIPETAYELTRHRSAQDQDFVCEYERARAAAHLVNRHLVFVDFTGVTDELRSAGMGGIPELATIVRAKLRVGAQSDEVTYPYTFWIDHAAAMSARMMLSGNYEKNDIRHILQNMPLQCRDYLAVPYQTPVWIFHQLSGEANSASPVADIDHTDANECKQFAMYLNFAIVTGQPTTEQMAKFRCTKHRRQPGRDYIIGHIDGDFCKVHDVSPVFCVDEARRAIVRRTDLTTTEVAGVSPRQRPRRQRTPRAPAEELGLGLTDM